MAKFKLVVFLLINFCCFCGASDSDVSIVTSFPPFCLPEQLMCDNGNCYDFHDICNFRDDCGDGTDERDCTTDCSFETEDDLCGWSIGDDSTLNWTITGFPAQEPGPATDHEGRNDTHMLSIWNKGPKLHNLAADLQSMMFGKVSKDCELVGWYYMAGEDDAVTIDMLSHHEHHTSIYPALRQTGKWEEARAKIYTDAAPGNFTLNILAWDTDGSGYIAIDDLKFVNCTPEESCTASEFQCSASRKCIPYFLVCDGGFHCSDGSDEMSCESKRNPGDCSFDRPDWLEACGWQEQPTNDDLDWILGNDTDVEDGGSGDHTFGGEGYYIYVTGSNGTGNIAQIAPNYIYPPSSDVCYLRFWYFFGNTTEEVNDFGSLEVFLLVLGGTKESLISISGEISEEWQEEITLVSVDKKFMVLFEAHTGDPGDTFIAMDDVSFTRECVTGLPPANSTCFLEQFECQNKQCIPKSGYCNGTKECNDGSDEDHCPTPPPLCDEITEFNCGDHKTCVPAGFMCDGYNDCPNNADEENCPNGTPCKSGSIYCADKFLKHPCMELNDVCYGVSYCYSYDLSRAICGDCGDFCTNNSTCVVDAYDLLVPKCSCANGYMGTRCQEIYEPPGPQGLSPGAITGIVLGSVALAGLLGLVVYHFVQKKQRRASQHARRDSPQGSRHDENMRMSRRL